jgi:hypothetical protein
MKPETTTKREDFFSLGKAKNSTKRAVVVLNPDEYKQLTNYCYKNQLHITTLLKNLLIEKGVIK